MAQTPISHRTIGGKLAGEKEKEGRGITEEELVPYLNVRERYRNHTLPGGFVYQALHRNQGDKPSAFPWPWIHGSGRL